MRNLLNAKNLLLKLKQQANNQVAVLNEVEKIQDFAEELTPSTYYDSYKTVFFFAIALSYLSQIASLISSYNFFNELLAATIPSVLILLCATIILLVLIEISKRLLTSLVARHYFSLQRKTLYLPLLFVVAISGLSMYASIVGGGKLGVDTQQLPTLEATYNRRIDSLAKLHQKEANILRNDIAGITLRNTWKGSVYLGKDEKALVYAKEQALDKVKANHEKQLAQLQTQYQQATHEVITYQAASQNAYRWSFGVIELLFFACLYFIYDFKRKVVLETMLNEENVTAPIQPIVNSATPSAATSPQNHQTTFPHTPNRIGFTFTNWDKVVPRQEILQPLNKVETNIVDGLDAEQSQEPTQLVTTLVAEGKRICVHCSGVYAYKTTWQKFCSEKCRMQFWEEDKGRPIVKKAKK